MIRQLSLFISLAILVPMALFTETNVLITKGYILTPDQLQRGEKVYQEFCSRCHGDMNNDAPGLAETDEWKKRLAKGMKSLAENAWGDYRGNEGTCPPHGENFDLILEDVELAVAYIVKTSTSK